MKLSKLFVLGAMAACLLPDCNQAARAETHTEYLNEIRTLVTFKLAEGKAQRLLPAGWEPNVATSGPAKGADFILVLIDRMLGVDATGKPLEAAQTKLAVFVVPGKETASGASGSVVVGGIAGDAAAAPGAYGAYRAGALTLDRTRNGSAAAERWRIESKDGDKLEIDLAYEFDVPTLVKFDQKVYSAPKPGFYRIYRGDQGAHLLYSAPTGRNLTSKIDIAASGSEIGQLLDGTQELISATALLWYRRDTYLP